MATYQCCFLDDRGHTEKLVAIRAEDAAEAQREAMAHMVGGTSFSGFELWGEGRRIITYRPAKDGDASLISRL